MRTRNPIKGPDISGLVGNWVEIRTGDGWMGPVEEGSGKGFGRRSFAKGTSQEGKGESEWPIFVGYVRLGGATREKGNTRDKSKVYFIVNEIRLRHFIQL